MIDVTTLHGAWELADFILEDSSGKGTPWGEDMRGLLLYDISGRMSISINKKIEEGESQAQATLDAMLYYSGTYRVDGDQIIHIVETASDPGRVGKELIRSASVHDGHLELKAPPQDWGHAVLFWRKIA